jgi:hypothetical protein
VSSLSTRPRSKPLLDEAGFQQLLAAAYVLQQHNDTVRAKDPRLDTAWIFSEIAQTQAQVREPGVDSSAAMVLVADRLRKVTDSSGATICLLSDGVLSCAAESGTAAAVRGGSIASNSLVANERLRNGREFHSSDAQRDTRLDLATCRELSIGSLLAVPIQRSGEIAGVVELRWSKPDAFHECDVRTCELMASLVAEILDTKTTESEPIAVEPQTFEPRIFKPCPDTQIEATPEPTAHSFSRETHEPFADPSALPDEVSQAPAPECRVCGRPFGEDEAFCGNCSMPRVAVSPTENLQSKWASMWFMQQAQEGLQEREREPGPPLSAAAEEKRFQEFQIPDSDIPEAPPGQEPLSAATDYPETPAVESRAVSLWRHYEPESIPDKERAPVSSGIRSVLQDTRVQLRMPRRATQLVIISAALFAAVLLWSIRPAGDPSHLTWFENLLVEFGLAEVPRQRPATHTGPPDIRVWVDVHTALYYCPGSDLYGKTPGGHFSTQRAAQEDQFEPATRATCE